MSRAKLVTPEQLQAIRGIVVGDLDLDWDSVVVPLVTSPEGKEIVLPDGKLLLRPPPAPAFEPWFSGLKERLLAQDLRKVPRAR
jgi:hypothetical protein